MPSSNTTSSPSSSFKPHTPSSVWLAKRSHFHTTIGTLLSLQSCQTDGRLFVYTYRAHKTSAVVEVTSNMDMERISLLPMTHCVELCLYNRHGVKLQGTVMNFLQACGEREVSEISHHVKNMDEMLEAVGLNALLCNRRCAWNALIAFLGLSWYFPYHYLVKTMIPSHIFHHVLLFENEWDEKTGKLEGISLSEEFQSISFKMTPEKEAISEKSPYEETVQYQGHTLLYKEFSKEIESTAQLTTFSHRSELWFDSKLVTRCHFPVHESRRTNQTTAKYPCFKSGMTIEVDERSDHHPILKFAKSILALAPLELDQGNWEVFCRAAKLKGLKHIFPIFCFE